MRVPFDESFWKARGTSLPTSKLLRRRNCPDLQQKSFSSCSTKLLFASQLSLYLFDDKNQVQPACPQCFPSASRACAPKVTFECLHMLTLKTGTRQQGALIVPVTSIFACRAPPLCCKSQAKRQPMVSEPFESNGLTICSALSSWFRSAQLLHLGVLEFSTNRAALQT